MKKVITIFEISNIRLQRYNDHKIENEVSNLFPKLVNVTKNGVHKFCSTQ